MSFESIFKNKSVLITGNTGFKGSWLSLWLHSLGAKVYGFSNTIPTNPSLFSSINLKEIIHHSFGDIRNINDIKKVIKLSNPDFIFHLAAQSLVLKSFSDPLLTINTNTIGTANLLDVLVNYKSKKKIHLILITSDKVYENNEWIWGYRENDTLGGKDPYSLSKAMAEFSIKAYMQIIRNDKKLIKNLSISIGRAGNVIGGADWAKNRLVPDCVSAWSKGNSVFVRNPSSTRPWQHVFEPLSGYLQIARYSYLNKIKNGEAYNFGPKLSSNKSVKILIKSLMKEWPGSKVTFNKTKSILKKEAGLLSLNYDKSLSLLKWEPVLNFDDNIKFTINWYKNFYIKKNNLKNFSLDQIEQYTSIAKYKKLDWAK